MKRRTLIKIAGAACGWNSLAFPEGRIEVSRGRLVLTSPPDMPPEGVLRYALAFPFQADSRTMGLMVMRMTERTPNYGFLDGSDIVLLDEFKGPGRIFASTRNEIERDRLVLKSPLIGGFVPLGALRPDGSPHPHAGTGFGIGQAHSFHFADRRFSWRDPDRQDSNEIYQLSWDGSRFSTVRSLVRSQNGKDLLGIGESGWSILVSGIKNAIPDGDDLLLAVLAARVDRSAPGIGVARWKRTDGRWMPAAFDIVEASIRPVPVGPNPMEKCPWMEPSLDRDADGALLFSARGADVPKGPGYALSVWRSDGGPWRKTLDVSPARLNSPVTVNATGTGLAYLVSNPYDASFVPETLDRGRGRERLKLWPLSTDRSRLESPILIRDCIRDFGPPPGVDKWMADHPNGMTVRLRDGKWHAVLSYRVCHSPAYASSANPPSKHSGSYVEEICEGTAIRGPWHFRDGSDS